MHCFAPQDGFAHRMGVAGIALQSKIRATCIALHTRMILHAELGLQALLCIPKFVAACIALHTRMVLNAEWGLQALLCIPKLELHALLCAPG